MIKNRMVALVFRLSMLVMIVVGLLMNFGVFRGVFQPGALMFYTVQSNLLALVLFAVLIVRTIGGISRGGWRGDAGYSARFKYVCVIDLMLTMVVYWVLLAPQMFQMTENYSMWSFDNLSVHLIAPLGCLLDYLLFTRSGRLKHVDVYATLIFPAAYLAFASVAGVMGYTYKLTAGGTPSHYPYPFMDYDKIGAGAIVYIVGIMVVLVAAAYVFYGVDRRLSKPAMKKAKI